MRLCIFLQGPELVGREGVGNRQVLVPGGGIVIGSGEGPVRVEHRNTAVLKAQESYRAGDFMHQVPVDKKHVWSIVDTSYHMGVPDFVEKRLAHGSVMVLFKF